MRIDMINNLKFEYFTKEELVNYKTAIDNRLLEIEKGLIIENRPLKYFASVDVMYGDADGYSTFTKEISREDYIKLKLFSFLDIEFYHEQLGSKKGTISDFIGVEETYYDLEEADSLSYWTELDHALEEIAEHIETYYPYDLDYEEIYKSACEQPETFDITSYKIDFSLPENHSRFLNTFIGSYWEYRQSKYQVLDVSEENSSILCQILNITPTKKYLFLNCLELQTKNILKVYECDDNKKSYINDAMYESKATPDFIGQFNLSEYLNEE